MTEGLLMLSIKELQRLAVMERIKAKQLTVVDASQLLGVSSRQGKRLWRSYRLQGAKGLVSKRRGKVSNNRHPRGLKERVLGIVGEHYADFGPTLAQEKLNEINAIDVSRETLRGWMQEGGYWQVKRRKKAVVHQLRERRGSLGELVQIDGSPHRWFEERGVACCLLVFVDDATGKLLQLRFEPTETTQGYFQAVYDYVTIQGLPLAFYSDKNSIFRVNAKGSLQDEEQTQFARAMSSLGIKLICANSPQAKGRVERMNGILQDRLIKEMRLRGINNIAAANKFMPEFMADYNRRFAVEPRSAVNAHRPVGMTNNALQQILSIQHTRVLSKNLELSYQNRIYQVQTRDIGYGLRHAKVRVCEDKQGQVSLYYKGRTLAYVCREKAKRTADVVSAKELNTRIDEWVADGRAKGHPPSKTHPWEAIRLRIT